MKINFTKLSHNAKVMRIAAIVFTVLPFVFFSLVFLIDEKYYSAILPLASVLSFFMPILLWSLYGAKFAPLLKSKKLLDSLNVPYEYWLEGIEQAPLLPKSRVRCTEKALISEKKKLVIPYKSILWVYMRVQKGMYGLVTVSKSMVICTTSGLEFQIEGLQDEEVHWLLKQYSSRFSRNVMFGFGVQQRKQWSAYKKQLRAEKKKS